MGQRISFKDSCDTLTGVLECYAVLTGDMLGESGICNQEYEARLRHGLLQLYRHAEQSESCKVYPSPGECIAHHPDLAETVQTHIEVD